jgi:hypothetical protein
MPEVLTRSQTFHPACAPGPMIDAIRAAQKAASMDGAVIFLEARWEDRVLKESRLDDDIRAAVLHAELPNRMSIFALREGRGQVSVLASDGLVTVNAEGADVLLVNRAFDAAADVMRDHAKPVTSAKDDLAVASGEKRAIIAQKASPATAVGPDRTAASERHPVRAWCNENQGLIGAVGVALTAAAILVAVLIG